MTKIKVFKIVQPLPKQLWWILFSSNRTTGLKRKKPNKKTQTTTKPQTKPHTHLQKNQRKKKKTHQQTIKLICLFLIDLAIPLTQTISHKRSVIH